MLLMVDKQARRLDAFQKKCRFAAIAWPKGSVPIPKGARTQIIGFWGPNTINVIVLGP